MQFELDKSRKQVDERELELIEKGTRFVVLRHGSVVTSQPLLFCHPGPYVAVYRAQSALSSFGRTRMSRRSADHSMARARGQYSGGDGGGEVGPPAACCERACTRAYCK